MEKLIDMKFIMPRLFDTGKQTFGFVSGHGYKAHTLEDEFRKIKLAHDTRIAAGIYPLQINKSETPLTLKHRESYGPWFKFHIQLMNVPQFQGIYIHSGIDETHTDGCLLFADACDYSKDKNPMSYSLQAIKRFYELVYPHLEKGGKAFIDIRDEIK